MNGSRKWGRAIEETKKEMEREKNRKHGQNVHIRFFTLCNILLLNYKRF